MADTDQLVFMRFAACFIVATRLNVLFAEVDSGNFCLMAITRSRENVLCPKCLSLERHRLMWLYLKNRTDFFTETLENLACCTGTMFL